MRLLFLGDVVGRPGRRALGTLLPRLVAREAVDFVVANGENASGGKGIDPEGAEELLDAGVDVLTSGNHIWQHAAILDYLRETRRLLRPLNLAPGVPGTATSEKVAMGRFLDGKVSAVIGSHTHVQTADESILPAGTAYLTDAGMCGPDASILGVKIEQVLRRFLTQMPTRFEVASGAVLVQGALIEVDEATGRATGIRRVQERVTA